MTASLKLEEKAADSPWRQLPQTYTIGFIIKFIQWWNTNNGIMRKCIFHKKLAMPTNKTGFAVPNIWSRIFTIGNLNVPLISNFCRVLNVVLFLLDDSQATEFLYRRFGTLSYIFIGGVPMRMKQSPKLGTWNIDASDSSKRRNTNLNLIQ